MLEIIFDKCCASCAKSTLNNSLQFTTAIGNCARSQCAISQNVTTVIGIQTNEHACENGWISFSLRFFFLSKEKKKNNCHNVSHSGQMFSVFQYIYTRICPSIFLNELCQPIQNILCVNCI